MSIYTTPLQFGYFLALSMAVLLWIRGHRQERLSDKLLGWVMFFLAMEIQDYTFGFAGINVLWNELNGFPRGTALLFGPSVYFYIRAQVNRSFKFKKQDLLHLLPWFIPFVIYLVIFLMGPKQVQAWQESKLHHMMSWPNTIVIWTSYAYYFYKSLSLYHSYRNWAQNQFSDQELISFKWFRNLLYFMIIGILFKESMNLIDSFMDLDFYQDWWWNLAMVGIIFYVGIWGYSQHQPSQISFDSDDPGLSMQTDKPKDDLSNWQNRIEAVMNDSRPWLESSLNLKTLSTMLGTNPNILSAAINKNFNKNFNDFINEYRIKEFLSKSQDPNYAHYTLLALALDSGFNSKSTFNRAFKKATGKTPKEIERG